MSIIFTIKTQKYIKINLPAQAASAMPKPTHQERHKQPSAQTPGTVKQKAENPKEKPQQADPGQQQAGQPTKTPAPMAMRGAQPDPP
jgi:hypothetical protein